MTNLKTIIEGIINTQRVAFIGSVDAEGFPNMKAMLPPRKREGIQTFYFTTNTSSMRVRQFTQNNRACIYFCDPDSFQGFMLKGTMEVMTDAAHKALIWLEGDTEYYKEGVTDPDYCVLKFTSSEGRYYSDFHSENFPIY